MSAIGLSETSSNKGRGRAQRSIDLIAATSAPPDLQEWIERFGGYWNIPWPGWDAVVAKYQRARRAYLGGPIDEIRERRRRRASRSGARHD